MKLLLPAANAPPLYDLKDLRAPVMTGFTLRTCISLMEGPAGAWLYPVIAWQSGLTQVGKIRGENPYQGLRILDCSGCSTAESLFWAARLLTEPLICSP